jgi:F-type H+-transporting ATPase subunit alpha
MSKPTARIEDVLDDVYQNVSFSSEKEPDSQPVTNADGLAFEKILDYSFPDDDIDSLKIAQVGEVTYVGDGICHITGLAKVKIEDIIDIHTENQVEKALVLGIEENKIEAVVLGDYSLIKRGDQAKASGAKLRVPVGKNTLGRVINPLGQPLDDLGPIHAQAKRDVEFPSPGVVDRVPITIPLKTGLMVIDTTIPIGKGQRELVIGDRKTGKSRTMIDIICNQKDHNVYCIYVGIGIQAAKAKATAELLKSRGALSYTTMVISHSDDPPTLQYLAPYVGAALGEYYMYQGKHALVIYDDLSKQAKAYRQVSLLLKRSPGRDAYPGDIFFLHSRLLERASQLTPKLGGGSLTALPIAETQGGDISDYIITNLMSITDGHIYLDANLMHEGIMPAVNSGASVSRIGGKVQFKLLQKVSELASRILARYNEVKSYETINTEVAEETIRDIKRGKRIKEMFGQDSEINLKDTEQVILLGIAASAKMDHFEPTHLETFKQDFIPYLRQIDITELEKKIYKEKQIEAIETQLNSLFVSFCRQAKLPLPSN